ncbi:iron chelate uptake ABC transporter family permease subunit [Staphylococcus aureus]
MQALTRNPIAMGFSVSMQAQYFLSFLVLHLSKFNLLQMIVVIAFLGAIVVTILVVALGMFRQTLFSPHRVILAGAAIAMLFTAFTQGILIMNETDSQG